MEVANSLHLFAMPYLMHGVLFEVTDHFAVLLIG